MSKRCLTIVVGVLLAVLASPLGQAGEPLRGHIKELSGTRINRPATSTLKPEAGKDVWKMDGTASDEVFQWRLNKNLDAGKFSLRNDWQKSTPTIPAQLSNISLLASNERLLENHDAVLLIDKSGSMMIPDCPNGQSRWRWCQENTLDLVQSSGKYFNNHVTIVPFDDNFNVFKDQDLSQVAKIFSTYTPGSGTNPEKAPENQLDDYFSRRVLDRNLRPLLVVIITDGMPNNPTGLKDVILSATRRMLYPTEVCITFLQIGSSRFSGARFLATLPDELDRSGAKYEIVDTTSFADLQKIGMKNALIAALLKQQPRGSINDPQSRRR